MLSSGGVIGAEVAGDNPVRMIESGPAAGALAASYYSKLLAAPDLLSFDMGGTTAKACFIQNGQPLITGDFEVDRIYRFKPGSGFPVTVPSYRHDRDRRRRRLAWRASTHSGLLNVGPQSAGSRARARSATAAAAPGRPSPTPTWCSACSTPTISSAARCAGCRRRAPGACRIRQELRRLGAEDAALGIYEVVGEQMASAARAHATDRGVDWRGIPLLAFGGAGPVHACYVAELLDSRMVIYPPMASVLSAFGTLVTPLRLDLFRSDVGLLRQLDWSLVDGHIAQMIEEARAALLKAGCADEMIRIEVGGDLRYQGQHNRIDHRPVADGHHGAAGRPNPRRLRNGIPEDLRHQAGKS